MIERMRDELDDLRLLNSSLLKEAQVAKTQNANAQETVPRDEFEKMQKAYVKVCLSPGMNLLCIVDVKGGALI